MKSVFYSLIGLLLLAVYTGIGNADAAASKGKEAYWHLTRNSDPKTGAFDYCATESSFDNGLSLAFARNQDFFTNVVIGFSQPKLEKQTKYPLTLVVDQNAPLPVTGFAADAKALVIPLKQNQQFISELAKGSILDMRGPRDSVKFSLQGAGEALNKLQDCVERSLAESGGQSGKSPTPQTATQTATQTAAALSVPQAPQPAQPPQPIILPESMTAQSDTMIQPLPLALPLALPSAPLAEPSPIQQEAANAQPEPAPVMAEAPQPAPAAPAAVTVAPPMRSSDAPPLPASATVERPPVEATSLPRSNPAGLSQAAPALPQLAQKSSSPLPRSRQVSQQPASQPAPSDSTDALNHMEAAALPVEPVPPVPAAIPARVSPPVAAPGATPMASPITTPALPKLASTQPTPMSGPAVSARQSSAATSVAPVPAPVEDTTESLNQLGTSGMENIPAARPAVSTVAQTAMATSPAPASISSSAPLPSLSNQAMSNQTAATISPASPSAQSSPAAAAAPLQSELRPQEQVVSSTSSTVIVPAIVPGKKNQSATPAESLPSQAMTSASMPAHPLAPSAMADNSLPALPPLLTSRRIVFPSVSPEPQSTPNASPADVSFAGVTLADILSNAGIDAIGHPVPNSTQVSYAWLQNNVTGSATEMPVSSASLEDFSRSDIGQRAGQCNGKFSPSVGAGAQNHGSIVIATSAATCVQGGDSNDMTLIYFRTAHKMGVIALETLAENQSVATTMRDQIVRALKSNSNYK